jgi:beta-glucosidase
MMSASRLPILCLLCAFAAQSLAMAQTTGQPPAASYAYQNPNLPIAQRVDDLVGLMTLEEKVGQMQTDAPAIPRLSIPEYHWWSECLHGFMGDGATVFPEPIGLAAAWDAPMHHQVARAIADEDRAAYNQTGQIGDAQPFHGLTFFSPNVNIFRDPRWGRGQETYGEDPFLTAQLGVAYVRGLQGDDRRYLEVVSTPKHFAVHSGPEMERHRFNATPSAYDLNDTYLPAFKACVVDGHAQSVMGAYSSLYGAPDCANPLLLQSYLRDRWRFDGYVVSDCGAIGDIYYSHHYAASMAEAAADAVKAGCDITCGGEYASLPDAVSQGLITEAQIDTSVKRLFTARMKLGMFDPPAMVGYTRIPATDMDNAAHRALARRAADESIVLLKNSGILPITKSVRSIAVIGPNAADDRVLLGNYNGTSSHQVTVLEGIRSRAQADGISVDYVQGSGLTVANTSEIVPASALPGGLRGEYFANESLAGAPAAVRTDPQIAFSWSGSGPGLGLSQFHYSVRWTGELVAPATGAYILTVRGDDGFRLWVGAAEVIDDWTVHPAEDRSATVQLTAGQAVPIRLEYFQSLGEAEIRFSWQPPNYDRVAEACAAAKRADLVVFVGGISSLLEGEEGTNGNGDRTSIDLPNVQDTLLKAVAACGKPVVLILLNGSALAVNWAQANLPAIVEAWYPGEEGGDAVADVLFGDYDPAGRLPVTFYRSLDQVPPFEDYSMVHRTYRYFDGDPLYPFGYGLSYTGFRYSALQATKRLRPGAGMLVTARITNTGSRDGDEVAELYLRPAPSSPARLIAPGQPMPRLELAGFQRIHIPAGLSRIVMFTVSPDQLILVDSKGARDLQPGEWQLYVGGCQPDLSGKPQPNVTSTRLDVQ